MPAFDPAKPVQTRDGRKATILTTAATQALKDELSENAARCYFAGRDTIIAKVVNRDGGFELNGYTANGHFFDFECDDDLVNVVEEAPVSTAYRTATLRDSGLAHIALGGVSFRDLDDARRVAAVTPRRWDAIVKVSESEGRLVGIEFVERVAK